MMMRAAEGFEWVSTMMTPSSVSMIAVLQLTLYAGAATATCTLSATFLMSKRASPESGPSWLQQSTMCALLSPCSPSERLTCRRAPG